MKRKLCHPELLFVILSEAKDLKEILRLCLRMTVMYIFFSGICYAGTGSPQVCHLANCVGVEVVSKPEDLQRGLMYRKGLEQDRGMFFVFTYDDRHPFWMKNMTFDLDMVWISQAGRIVFIGQNIPACKTDPCPVYTPNQPCRYVLELSRGYIASHGWKVGDDLTIPSSDLKNIGQHG